MKFRFPIGSLPREETMGLRSLLGIDPGDSLPSVNLSRALLEKVPHPLGIVPVKRVRWSDWGNAGRIRETLVRIGRAEGLIARLEQRYRRWEHVA